MYLINYNGYNIHFNSPPPNHIINELISILNNQINDMHHMIKIPNYNITHIPLELINSHIHISNICMSHNKISIIPNNFEHLIDVLILDNNLLNDDIYIPANVQQLYINNNKIKKIFVNKDTFHINASHNNIEYLYGDYSSLNYLNLYNNKLKSINLKNSIITTLNCGMNLLTSLSSIPYTIQNLNISSNNIQGVLNVSSLHNLTVLNCTSNHITFIKFNKQLETLYASGNNIPTLIINAAYLNSANLCSCGIKRLIIRSKKFNSIVLRDNPIKFISIDPITKFNTIECNFNNLYIMSSFKHMINTVPFNNNNFLRIHLNSAAYCIQKFFKHIKLMNEYIDIICIEL